MEFLAHVGLSKPGGLEKSWFVKKGGLIEIIRLRKRLLANLSIFCYNLDENILLQNKVELYAVNSNWTILKKRPVFTPFISK